MSSVPLSRGGAQGQSVGLVPLRGNTSSVPTAVIDLASRKVTALQRWTGLGLDDCGRLGRLLLFRSLALEADLQCRWNRSDFFWIESHRQLRAVLHDANVWTAAVDVVAMQADAQRIAPDTLRDAVVDELFVNTYLGLIRAARESWPAKPDSREFVYTRYVRDIFDIVGAGAERQADVLLPHVDHWIGAESEAKEWKSAIRIVRDMIARLPQERKYPEQLMLLEYQSTLDSLTQNSPLTSRDAKTLRAGIDRIECLRAQYTWIPAAFTLIGRLRHLRAIALANGNVLAEALVESQKGMDYSPGEEDAVQTDQRLVEAMKAKRQSMEAVVQQLQTGFNKRLTPEGQSLVDDAKKGFSPVNEYIKSAERRQLQQDAIAARNKGVWLSAGYAEPPADWTARAEKLYDAMADVLQRQPAAVADLEPLWHAVSDQDEILAALDPRSAIAFLARRLFPEESPDTGTAVPPLDSHSGPDFTFDSTVKVPGDEPLPFWLFSRQGMRLKIQTAIAILLLLSGLGLAAFDAVRTARQNRDYSALVAASNDGDFFRMIEASEDFLAHPALHQDDRTAHVLSLYSEALVRWFSSIPDRPDDAAVNRVRRYQQLANRVQ